jgi:hypothetical protein
MGLNFKYLNNRVGQKMWFISFTFCFRGSYLDVQFRFSEENKNKFMMGLTLRKHWWNDSQGLAKTSWTKEEKEAVRFYDRLMECAITQAQNV